MNMERLEALLEPNKATARVHKRCSEAPQNSLQNLEGSQRQHPDRRADLSTAVAVTGRSAALECLRCVLP